MLGKWDYEVVPSPTENQSCHYHRQGGRISFYACQILASPPKGRDFYKSLSLAGGVPPNNNKYALFMRERKALFLSPLNKGEEEEPFYGLCAPCFTGGVRSRFIRLFSCNRGNASVNAVLVVKTVESGLVNFGGFP